jgi:hypothetical protein
VLQWNPAALFTLDVACFEAQATQTGSLAVLRQAVTLYGGDLLPVCYAECILAEQ